MSLDLAAATTSLIVPRGRGFPPLNLNLAEIWKAENRLAEAATVTVASAGELLSSFNAACNETGKYVTWLRYEMEVVQREYDAAKSEVIIDEMPAIAAKYKEAGMKVNEDVRNAMICKNQKCQELLEKQQFIKACVELLENKAWSFIRAQKSIEKVISLKDHIQGGRINAALDANLSQNAAGFMGTTRY